MESSGSPLSVFLISLSTYDRIVPTVFSIAARIFCHDKISTSIFIMKILRSGFVKVSVHHHLSLSSKLQHLLLTFS